MCRPCCTVDRQRLGLRMVGRLLAPATCVCSLQLYAPETAADPSHLRSQMPCCDKLCWSSRLLCVQQTAVRTLSVSLMLNPCAPYKCVAACAVRAVSASLTQKPCAPYKCVAACAVRAVSANLTQKPCAPYKRMAVCSKWQ